MYSDASSSGGVRHFSAVSFVTMINRYIKCTQDTQRKAEPILIEIYWNLHGKYWDIIFTLVVCNSRAGTEAPNFALDYPGRRRQDAKCI
jgi:hypothetical protein